MTVQAMLVFASIIRCVESVMCTNKNIYLFLPKKKKKIPVRMTGCGAE